MYGYPLRRIPFSEEDPFSKPVSRYAAHKLAGKGFTCGHEKYMTGDQYHQLLARALKVEAVLVHVPKELLLPLEKRLIPDDLLSELTQFHVAFSHDKFRSFFPEFRWIKTLEQAARECAACHEGKGHIPALQTRYEDRIIAAWKVCRRSFEQGLTGG